MTRTEMLEKIRQSRAEFESLMKQAPASEPSTPVLANGWSIKDLYGHLGFWERRAAAVYTFLTGGAEPDPKLGNWTADDLNALAHAAYKDLGWAETFAAEQQAYQDLWTLAETAPETDLFDPQRFGALQGMPFVDWILNNSAGHYEEHRPDLHGWLGLPGAISYNSGGTIQHGYSAAPSEGGLGVIVLHAWWGLNPFFQGFCDRLAREGFVVLAPDLNDGKLAGTVAEAMAVMEKRDFNKTEAAALSAVEQIRRQPGLRPGKLGVVGFSLGAAYSTFLAAARPEEIGAAVLFYGGPGTDFSQARAAFLGHFAEVDEWEPEEGVRQMEAELSAAGRETVFHHYPGTGHWFFESDRPDAFQPEAAALAWERTVAFLKEKLGGR